MIQVLIITGVTIAVLTLADIIKTNKLIKYANEYYRALVAQNKLLELQNKRLREEEWDEDSYDDDYYW